MFGLSGNDLGQVLIGLSVAIMFFMGGKKGKEVLSSSGPQKQPTPQENMVEVAGAIVSDKMAMQWVDAADRLAECIKVNTLACREAASSAKDASDAMEVLTREIIRGK